MTERDNKHCVSCGGWIGGPNIYKHNNASRVTFLELTFLYHGEEVLASHYKYI